MAHRRVATTAPIRSPPRTASADTADSDVDGQIGLPPADRPEVEAAGPVDQDGDVEVALLDRVPDVRLAGPGKDRPVHPADVVARLVRSRFSGLDTVAEHERGMTAVSAAEDLVADRELDAAEPCRQVETGTAVRRSPRGRWVARQDDRWRPARPRGAALT